MDLSSAAQGAADVALLGPAMAIPRKTLPVALADHVSLSSLGEALPYIVYVYELATGSMTYLNRDLGRELGYGSGELGLDGPTLFDRLMHEEDRAHLEENLGRWADARDEDVLEAEYRMREASGEWRWFLSRDCVLERDSEGRVIKILGTALDITERKSLEAQLQVSQKLEALGRLSGGIAHDFNNILTVVLGNADLARTAIDDREWVADCLDQIRNAANQASALTRSLLAFARQQVLSPEVLDVSALLRETERLLRRLLGEDIDLRFDLSAYAGSVRMDRSQLTQIVLNLAVNARDAMPDGGTLSISTGVEVVTGQGLGGLPELRSGTYLRISVDDSGTGMDLATQRRIFEPFFSTKPEHSGSGLGLATVYGIVRQCEGTIKVSSEVGRGSSFSVYLPQVSDHPLSDDPQSVVGARSRGQARVLLVEDAAPVAAVIREVLERAGYRVELARNGRQALAWLAEASELDLLICDLILPGCSGLEVARETRRRWPGSSILMISGHPRELDEASLRGLRAEFMAKPFAPEALLVRVGAILADATASSST